eukprot:6181412-Pleurochrysis_carterae.AAC.1
MHADCILRLPWHRFRSLGNKRHHGSLVLKKLHSSVVNYKRLSCHIVQQGSPVNWQEHLHQNHSAGCVCYAGDDPAQMEKPQCCVRSSSMERT